MTNKKLSWPLLGKISQQEFLSKYWQKKPLLLKGALKPFPTLITPDEVAGLSCDPRVESRLILEKGGKTPWELRRGPFKPSLFGKLPKTHWTILVNGVDRFIPAVHAFLDEFSFIPFWRIDDVMISVAYDQGNVGAHVDNFDVFLVQGAGTREWLIEDRPVMQDDFVPDLPIRLLRKFNPTHKWTLEEGDILYLPPRFPHHGIARGDRCMTISVGFRAPTLHEIINGLVNDVLANSDDSIRYSDPDLRPQAPGEISKKTIEKLRHLISHELLSEGRFEEWWGKFVTSTYDDVAPNTRRRPISVEKLREKLSSSSKIVRTEGTRCAYTAILKNERSTGKAKMQTKGRTALNDTKLYINGELLELRGKPAELARAISDAIVTECSEIRPLLKDKATLQFLAGLIQRGAVVIE